MLCLLIIPGVILATWLFGVVEITFGMIGATLLFELLIIASLPLFLVLGIALGVAGICRDAEKVRAIVATGVHALALVLFFFAFAVTIMFALNMPID